MIKFEILSAEEFNADFYGLSEQALTDLGGCSSRDGDTGLGIWTYQFGVDVTNQNGETKAFTVAYQPEERTNGMKAYSGYDVTTAAKYGYDADQSTDLEQFCDYDTSVLDALHKKAKSAAKAEFYRLTESLK